MNPKPAHERPRFVHHGNFATMPLDFPQVTEPIPADESWITALAFAPHGRTVVGGTSGRRAHLFLAAPRCPGGYVVDLGSHDDATSTAQVLAFSRHALWCVNSPTGGAILGRRIVWPTDGIQEWAFDELPLELLAELPGEEIRDACIHEEAAALIVLTDARAWRLDLRQLLEARLNEGRLVDPLRTQPPVAIANSEVATPAITRLAQPTPGLVIATLAGARLIRIDPESGAIDDLGVDLPFASATGGWTALADGRLLVADDTGGLYVVDIDARSASRVAQAPQTPVTCMAALPDGRVYGCCGEGVNRFFLFDVPTGEVADLGVPCSVLGAKRYGYAFGCATVGPDGEIYFGENDRGGHLWVYFPPVGAGRASDAPGGA